MVRVRKRVTSTIQPLLTGTHRPVVLAFQAPSFMNWSIIRGKTSSLGITKRNPRASSRRAFHYQRANSEGATKMIPVGATAIIPGVMAIFVGVSELRSDETSAGKVRNLVPVVLALAVMCVYFLLDGVIPMAWSYLPWLSYSMAFLAVIVGFSGIWVKYSHKANTILMALVGLLLACYWAFLSLPRT